MTKRNLYLDFVKFFAILLVVFSHNIQFSSGIDYYNNQMYFDNSIYIFIYSFHMPLFMLISGYLSFRSINKRTLKENIINQISSLLIPIIIWTIPLIIIDAFKMQELNFLVFIKHSISLIIHNLWFLWALFYCNILVSICKNFKYRTSTIIYIFGLIITFFTPDIFNLHVHKFMYPFFLIGYFSNLFIDKVNIMTSKKKTILSIITIVIFITLLIFYNRDSFIYTSKYSLITSHYVWYKQLSIDIYRFFVGLFGSLSILILLYILFNVVKKSPIVVSISSNIGKRTLGIYILSFLIQRELFKICFKNCSLNYMVVILMTILLVSFCMIMCYIIEKNKYINKLLLGGRK